MANRPLSPHLFIYRFAYTMATSIFHRVTGLLLSGGLLLLVVFLANLAGGQAHYDGFHAFAASIGGRLLIAVVLIAFCYHLANGIRHLFWDMGMGMERAQARRSATVVTVLTVLGAAVVVWQLFGSGAAS